MRAVYRRPRRRDLLDAGISLPYKDYQRLQDAENVTVQTGQDGALVYILVINPPDGDMRAYLASLERLLEEDLAIIAPGHDFLIGTPHRELRRLIAHRLSREAKVRRALAQHGPASLDALVPFVYDDVSSRMHRWAARSLSAHLGKLLAEGAVAEGPDGFALVESSKEA